MSRDIALTLNLGVEQPILALPWPPSDPLVGPRLPALGAVGILNLRPAA